MAIRSWAAGFYDQTDNLMPIDQRLKETYGAGALGIRADIEARPELGELITADLPYLRAEIEHTVQHEMTLSLSDVFIRRMHVIYEIPDAGLPQAHAAAALMAERLVGTRWNKRNRWITIGAKPRVSAAF